MRRKTDILTGSIHLAIAVPILIGLAWLMYRGEMAFVAWFFGLYGLEDFRPDWPYRPLAKTFLYLTFLYAVAAINYDRTREKPASHTKASAFFAKLLYAIPRAVDLIRTGKPALPSRPSCWSG